MATNHWILLQGADQWHIGWKDGEEVCLEVLIVPADAGPEEVATVIADTLETLKYKGEAVLLAVHSSLCLAATISLDDQTAPSQSQALLYQFEEEIPMAAEEVVADFVVHDREVFGVAIPTLEGKSLVDALETHGIQIQSVSPAALLALQYDSSLPETDEPYIVLWQHDDEIEWFRMTERIPLAWRILPADSSTLSQHLHVEMLIRESKVKVLPINLSSIMMEALSTFPGLEIQTSSNMAMLDATVRAAREVLAGNQQPWIELRRDALGSSDPYRSIRGSLRFVFGTVVALLLTMIGGWSYQAYYHGQLIDQAQRHQEAAFRKAFPGQPVPAGIRSRLESEHAKLSGIKGVSSQLPMQVSAVNMLHDVLASLPENVRYRIHEIRLDRQKAFLEGEVLSHGDADKISAGLRKQNFAVQPPRTRQISGGGVSLRITAKLSK